MSATTKPAKKAAPKRPSRPVQPVRDEVEQYSDDQYSDAVLAEIAQSMQDAPAMMELHHLSRRRRAVLVRKLEAILPRLSMLEQGAPSDITAGDVMDLVADVEDILADFAVQRDVFVQWAADADDQELLALMAQLAGRVASGEARSSSS